jgi:hypothetical protein
MNYLLSGGLSRRLAKFVIKRTVGQFLENELDLDQLEVNIGTGSFTVSNVALNVAAMNELLVDTPFQMTSGSIQKIELTIPWNDMWGGWPFSFSFSFSSFLLCSFFFSLLFSFYIVVKTTCFNEKLWKQYEMKIINK